MMKRYNCSFILSFFLYGAIVLMTASAPVSVAAQPKFLDDPYRGSEAKADGCPRVWVKVTPAFFPHSPADHTYVNFLGENDQCQSFPCFGACTGGSELPDTKSPTWENNRNIIQYMAEDAPCKWPNHYYLIIGVCHQLANRSLFHTGKIVKNARMYEWSSFVYQTYGACFQPLQKYCMNNCLEASARIGTWQPGAPPVCLPSEKERVGAAQPDAEYQLYMKHFGNMKVIKDVQYMTGRLKAYRNNLLVLHINQRLGEEYMDDYLAMLSKGQNELLEKKDALDLRLLPNERLSDNMIDKYNKLFNESLARFRSQMPKDLYERFFGLPYDDGRIDQQIDMRMFLPKE